MSQKLSSIILIIGIILIVISQTVTFEKKGREHMGLGMYVATTVENTELKNGILFSGIALLAIGGISLAIIIGNKAKKE